ncbi:hypothetical protein [Pannonibacter phragmitetus]|uniref:hypothetical protein n=1 Tax=Pannonibacter phragmitetus TaxID=121719 RepID=UPI003D2F1787
MSLIEPHRFTPHENGRAACVTLPGLHRDTHVDVLRIGRGLVLAHSHFSPAERHEDEIRRPEDQLILAFNLSGRMVLTNPRGHGMRSAAARPGSSGRAAAACAGSWRRGMAARTS